MPINGASPPAGDWYVSVQVEYEAAVVPANRGVEIGIDLGGVQPIVPSRRFGRRHAAHL